MIEKPYYLLAVFLGIILLSLWLDSRYKWASKISPVVMILFLSGLFSNVGLITDKSPFYENLADFTVPFAVCLILFTVNLNDLRRLGRPFLVAFVIACIGSALGTMTAGLVLNPELMKIMGNDSWKLAGPFAGTYIGGSLNFFAMWEGLQIENPDLFGAANAVDNLTLFPLFTFWILVPVWLGKWFITSKFWSAADEPATENDKTTDKPELRIMDIVGLSFAAMTVIVLSDLIKKYLIPESMQALPTILIVTTLALIVAQFKLASRFKGAFEIGNLSFYLFFCAVGAMINVKKAIFLSPVLFGYTLIIILVHLIVVYGVGRLFRLDIRILTLASVATATGPPIVVAVADAHGWKSLVLPGVGIGLLGYAVGNYFGFATAYTLKALLGL